jgi:hypothetical protein
MEEPTPKDVLEAGAKALFGPVYDLVMKLTGPAAEEYGLMWAESVRMRRTKRLVNGLTKTKRMVEEAGFEPQIVPDKLLLPIFEGMSVEDDESLQAMWAALLANASSPENAEKVRPGFIAILKQMTRDEGRLLNWIFDQQGHPAVRISALVVQHSCETTPSEALPRSSSDEGSSELGVCLNGLEASFLIQMHDFKELSEPHYALTARGYAFVTACRPPARRPK